MFDLRILRHCSVFSSFMVDSTKILDFVNNLFYYKFSVLFFVYSSVHNKYTDIFERILITTNFAGGIFRFYFKSENSHLLIFKNATAFVSWPTKNPNTKVNKTDEEISTSELTNFYHCDPDYFSKVKFKKNCLDCKKLPSIIFIVL